MKKIRQYFFFCLFLHLPLVATDDNSDTLSLRENVTIDGIRAHQHAFQLIADAHHHNREAGTEGFTASVAYVKNQLENAGYQVHLQDFLIYLSADKTPPVLINLEPEQIFLPGQDFLSMVSLGTSDIIAPLEAVDLTIPSQAPNHSTSGCQKDDFKDFIRGNIALIQRGSCTFRTKVENAISAGAAGVIIFNEGNENRIEAINSRLAVRPENYPILGASFLVGDTLRHSVLHGPTGQNVRIAVDVINKGFTVQNVIAETDGDKNRVTVVGAHLDSVDAGPGINDNGSGSATILAIAEQIQKLNLSLPNKLRFIWFAAEESGLLGSEHYVKTLSHDEKNNIMAMLNFDMLGSSNYARFVYDGDGSGEIKTTSGSAYIETVFLNYFSSIGLITHPTAFDGRSDYGPFIRAGIPAGGLFSGAEGLKSESLARIYGGQANEPFDPCYHQACDDFFHTGGSPDFSLALKSLDELSDAAAHAIVRLGTTQENIKPPQAIEPNIDFEYQGNYLLK